MRLAVALPVRLLMRLAVALPVRLLMRLATDWYVSTTALAGATFSEAALSPEVTASLAGAR